MNTALLPPYAAELVEWLQASHPAAAPAALAAAGLAAARADEGHVCVELADMAGSRWNGIELPALADWRAALLASGFVAAPAGYAPLLLDGDRLYLARLWADEVTLAAALRRRAGPAAVAPERVRAALDPLFAGTPADDGQRRAAATALLNRVAVISGGPGTGKTTTVAKVLAALVALEPGCRIRLAAPTGKAAARMVEALAGARERLGLDLVTQAALPAEAITLHRLLGFRPDSARPRHDAAHPLALDALVVDEASMIDLALFARLLEALPADARLILLGDRDQLASVEAGSAFAELVTQAGHSTAGLARLAAATGMRKPASPAGAAPDAGALADGIALLEVSHRFDSASGIGALAQLANRGQADAAIALLRQQPLAGATAPTAGELAWQPGRAADWLPALVAGLEAALAGYRAAVAARDADAAWRAFERLRLLCALRDGPVGVEAINRLVETRVLRHDPRRQPWYPGRPVIVRANDTALGLANGDVGLTLATDDGLRVHFPAADGWRALAPGRLPAHDTAFALTVHQSQGSEFDAVWLLLPDEDAPLLDRSLVYTAVTRARRQVAIWGSAATLAAAIGRETRRASGLAARLADGRAAAIAHA
ncbi:exodeoxyribonuclease V subunit alpha [Chitinimonas koreensis]|uniref:exodeoxyribonuclease V subunit alpha n=1 Tax=Chitinimonas koreensis TaxID=356302 RepID=UPI0004001E0B|nr:exodeoxyribonuclease V subunit alpha [Chitinimonas koreensis]QNM96510.1 exodeoxyribonuclease V subunit alpha [Chitinimonas koreensis]